MNIKKQKSIIPISNNDYDIIIGVQKRLKEYDSELVSQFDIEDRVFGVKWGGNRMADRLSLNYPFTIKKNEIEGVILSYKKYSPIEVIKFIINSNGIEKEERIADECSLNALNYLRETPFWGVDQILKAHKLLMKEKNIPEKYKGTIRDKTVYIARRKCDQSTDLIYKQLTEWLKLMYQFGDSIQSLLILHAIFEYIHPFLDGNGRIGRLLYLAYSERLFLPFRYFSDNPDVLINYYRFLGRFDTDLLDMNRFNFFAYKEVYRKEDKNMLKVI